MSDPIKLSMLMNSDEVSQSVSPDFSSTSDNRSFTNKTPGKSNTEYETSNKVPKTRGRKKVLIGPPYICQFPNCNKTFQRSEHLSRHKLNHNPKTIFNCSFFGCNKTFVRHDLLLRHLKRHENKMKRQKLKNDRNTPTGIGAVNSPNLDASTGTNTPQTESEIRTQSVADNSLTSENQDQEQLSSVSQIIQQHNPHFPTTTSMPLDDPITPNLIDWLFTDGQLNAVTKDKINEKNSAVNTSSSSNTNLNNFLSDLNEFHLNNNTQSFFIVDGFDDFSPTSNNSYYSNSPNKLSTIDSHALLNINLPPDASNIISANTESNLLSFQHSQGQQDYQGSSNSTVSMYGIDENLLTFLTDNQMKEFGLLIPALKENIDFTKPKFQKALKTYWNFFHPRFPMLHRPTFNASETPSLLLLSMVILGSKLFMCIDTITCPDEKKLSQPKILADTISEPLRWLLFSSPFFQPPAEIWIIQSLLMLEFYEKNCSNRQLHERAHLHHGTTIQLLRRSPTLGGSQKKYYNGPDGADNWYKWIEIESMKRTTYMCFYMDAIDAISFGHQMLIYAHQIQMTMPVEDAVWESNFSHFNQVFKRSKRPQPFLMVLKNIMNGLPSRTNSFGKKVLLAGLNAIMFQIQQRDLQLFFGLDKFSANKMSNNWRELLTAAFTIWRTDVGGSCCSSKTAIDNLNSLGNSAQFSTSDTRCKCITYHMAHVYMSASHYDLFIMAGAPWRMNVKPSSMMERKAIEKRVKDWSTTRHAEVCIVQCYLLLFEMFLSPQDSPYEYQYDYVPDADLFFRSYVIGYCTLVLWCYNYVKMECKPISTKSNGKLEGNAEDDENDGYRYLKQIRNAFTFKSGGVMLHTWFTNNSGSEFYGNLIKWVNVLNAIEDKENMVGLLTLVGNKLGNADYTVVKEIGKLLLFCKDRSKGSPETILHDMYASS